MTNSTFFEIGGELIELKADYDYGAGNISATRRKQQKTIVKNMKSVGKSMDKMQKTASSDDGWGPAESIGYGLGLAAGIAFGIATFPITQADTPLIGPADLAWFAGAARFMDKSTNIGRRTGEYVDDQMGWD